MITDEPSRVWTLAHAVVRFRTFGASVFCVVCRESVSEIATDEAGQVTEQQGAVDMSLVSSGE